MKVSIVIPCSLPAGTQALLDAVLQQTLFPELYEIIVVVPYNAGKLPTSDPRLRVVGTTVLFPLGHMRNRDAEEAEN